MKPARNVSGTGAIADQLRRRLLALDYPAFARCVCRLLEALGYEDVRLAGRREWKGYNRPGGGGYDLEAELPGGLTPRRVVAQIKQYDGPRVHQRSVDELRGACLRAAAAEGLLITTSTFSDVVRKHAEMMEKTAAMIVPVRLIGGEELLELMLRHRIGIRESNRGGTRFLEIDDNFFGNVAAPGMTDSPPQRCPAQRSQMPTRWRVTVRISQKSRRLPPRGGRAEGNR